MPAVENVPDLSAEEKENRETRVELSTMIPEFCRPMNVMKKPIPTDTAIFNCFGMELKMASRTFVTDMTMKMRPSMNTAVKATCQS